jgi:DHA1 family multidrug resistance protein-like MFS transporter
MIQLVMTQSGMIIMPIGILILGWTARAETHWIGPQIGQAIAALGLMLAFNSIQHL